MGPRARQIEAAWFAAAKRHRPGGAVAIDLDVKPRRERVHHRGTHAVKPARGVVRPRAELPTRVQLGEDDLHPRQSGTGFGIDGDAATAVVHGDGAVRPQENRDLVAEPTQGLVDGIVDDLPQAVHETTSVGGADVHRRPLPDGLEAFEDEQVARFVFAVLRGRLRGRHGPRLPPAARANGDLRSVAERRARLVRRCASHRYRRDTGLRCGYGTITPQMVVDWVWLQVSAGIVVDSLSRPNDIEKARQS